MTEAARALRALFLNIVGDTKTEIDEGVTWTTGEIAGLKDVIKQYAPEAYKAAQATGSIIDPMQAIGGLAKSMQEGLLTEQTLMEMVSDIGGKLRTSQLLALIQNWDMYNDMLKDTANSAGSADKEIENAMDSWTRKTNVLKNTWTEFIKTSLNSGQIKFLLDALTFIIQRLGTLTGTVSRLALIFSALKLHSIANELTGISKGLIDVERDASKAAKMLSGIGASASTLNVAAGVLGALGLAWSVVTFAVESYHRAQEKAREETLEAVKATKEDISTLDDLKARYEAIISSTADEATKNRELAEYKKQLIEQYGFEREAVEKINLERQTGLELLDKEAEASLRRTISENWDTFEDAADHYRGERRVIAHINTGGLSESLPDMERLGAYMVDDWGGMGYLTVKGNDLRDTYENLSAVIDVLEKKQLSRNGLTGNEEYLLDELRTKYADLGDELADWGDIYEGQIELMARYNLMLAGASSATVDSRDAFDGLKRTLYETYGADAEVWEVMNRLVNEMFPEYASGTKELAEETDKETDATEKLTGALFANQKALDATATAEERAAAAKKDAEAAARALIPVLFDENGKLTAVGIAALEADNNLGALVQSELDAQYAAAQANYSSVIAQIAMIGDTAAMTTVQLANMASVFGLDWSDNVAKDQLDGMKRTAQIKGTSTQAQIMSWAQSYMNSLTNIHTGQTGALSGYGGGGSSSSSGSRSGGGGSGGRSGSSSGDSQLDALKDRVAVLKSELSLLDKKNASDASQIAKMKEIQNALHNQADYMRSIGGSQSEINNLSVQWYEYQAKIKELMNGQAEAARDQADALERALEAQRALDNAMRDRSVRYYNKESGKWEWAANAQNVSNALKARDEAVNATSYAGNLADWLSYYSLIGGLSGGGDYNGSGSNLHNTVLGHGYRQNIPAGSYSNVYGGASNTQTYNFGGIHFTEAEAKSMTLYDLAQRSRLLALHGSTY